MSAADDQPTLPFPPAAEPQRRRRAWPWLLTLLIVLLLLVGAAVLAEWLARGAVTGGIRTLIVQQLDLPADQQIDVDVDGIVIPQLISGTLDDVTVASSDVEVGELAGDVSVNITDMPIRADAAAGPGTATVRLDEAQLQSLLVTVEGFPAESVDIAAPEVTLSTDLNLFGAAIPVGVALLPGVDGADLTLTPQSASVAGAEVSADALRSQFGGLVDPLVRTWDICIAQYLPSALTLTAVRVEGAEVVASFDIDGAVVVDSTLRQNGTCV